MKLARLTVAAAFVLAGCASPVGQSTSTVQPSIPELVAGCAYIDDVVGTSGLYGSFASQGAANARADALQQAAAAGATHVVWSGQIPGHGSTGVTAKAYRCRQ